MSLTGNDFLKKYFSKQLTSENENDTIFFVANEAIEKMIVL